MSITVAKAYTSQYPDPISFDASAVVLVVREDPEFAGWFWCREPSGKEGWVHRSFLSACSGTTTSSHAYSARELTVVEGECGTILQSLDGWAFVRMDSGDEGWIPLTHLNASGPQLT